MTRVRWRVFFTVLPHFLIRCSACLLISLLEYFGFESNNIRVLADDQDDQPWNLPTEENIVSYPYKRSPLSPNIPRSAGGHALVGRGRPTW